MDQLLILAITFALSQVVLSGLLLVRSKAGTVQERLYALLLLAITAYLLAPIVGDGILNKLMSALSTAVPGMFWLFSASLFDDHFRLQRWQLILVTMTVAPPAIYSALEVAGVDSPYLLFVTLPQLLEFVLLGFTLVVVARYWRVDLIASRRSLRLWFCGLNGAYIFLLIFVREVVISEIAWLNPLQYLPVGGVLLATNALLLEYKKGVLGHRTKPKSLAESEPMMVEQDRQIAAVEVPEALLQQLQMLMEDESCYKETGLTIGKLAARMGIPDHRLRQIINAGLGYRNFNDFLNSFRVRESSRRLANPAERHLPVLTIAMETGFRSLSSYNKVFKETYHMTPTAYRRQQLDGS